MAALVLGLLWLCGLGSLAALVFGVVALTQLGRNPADSGKGMAIAGVVLGAVGLLAVPILALAVLLPAARSVDRELEELDAPVTLTLVPETSAPRTTSLPPPTLPLTPVTVSPVVPPPGAAVAGAAPCPPVDGSAARTTSFGAPPAQCIDPARSYLAVVSTNVGALTIALDAARAPVTVNNFVVLARYHYYDGVPFHRIVTDFVAQAGDANPEDGRLGTGGPGYTFPDELWAGGQDYRPGVVAMANAGPNTHGSQFFIFVGPDNPFLQMPAYTIFGTVTQGMDGTVARIMDAGTADQGVTAEIIIERVDIIES